MVLKDERDAANLMAQQADARVESAIKAVEAWMENEFEDLLVTYNANVLRNCNLNWLGKDYPF